ncbi:hypothetical protein G2W53_024049 [Senna tora]|uniref:Uncharacterized protein n=1 Tax=Senna tora TaxID=362788 RepID=A0A834TJE2_9FABA|nr:hypothetical protein G2W53_024049 [Senna tora]
MGEKRSSFWGRTHSPPSSTTLFDSRTFSDFIILSFIESSSSLKNPNFSCVDVVVVGSILSSLSQVESVNSVFSIFVLCSSPVSSSLLNGEPKNLEAKDEDLYGADLHLVRSKAFLGGVVVVKTETFLFAFPFTFTFKLALSSYSSSSNSSSSLCLSLEFDSVLVVVESCLTLVAFLRKNPHLGQRGWQGAILVWQNRACRSHQQRRFLAGVLPLLAAFCLEERRTLTWPMHVTLGEEGSWVSMAVVFFLTNIGLDLDLPRLLLPTLLLKNLINGGGNFSVRPGLEMGLADSFMFILAW